MDPDVLRAREGVTLNKSLLTFATCLRRLSSGEPTDFLAEEATLTKMIQDALGGNSHALMISTLKTDSPRDWQQNITTMRYASTVRRVRNFPCINNNMTRTLFKQFRSRLIHLKVGRSRSADVRARNGARARERPCVSRPQGSGTTFRLSSLPLISGPIIMHSPVVALPAKKFQRFMTIPAYL